MRRNINFIKSLNGVVLAKQMDHANIETVIKVYGKWISNPSVAAGYKSVNDWSSHIELKQKGPNLALHLLENRIIADGSMA